MINKTIAQTLSNLMHPLLMLTYATLFQCWCTPLTILPAPLKWFMVVEVFFYSCLIPVATIGALFKLKIIGHWALRNRTDRAVPLLINALAYILCAVALTHHRFLPTWALSFYYGAVFMALLVWGISFWWKISAHATGIGAMATATLILYVSFPNFISVRVPVVSVALVGLLCSLRLYLSRHTPAQVAAGTLLGVVTMGLTFYFFA